MERITIYSWALALLMIAAPVTVAIAQTSTSQTESTSDQVVGTISSVDAATNNVTIQKKDNTTASYRVDTSTAITLDGKAAKLADLKTGNEVTLTMDGLKVVSIKAASKPTT